MSSAARIDTALHPVFDCSRLGSAGYSFAEPPEHWSPPVSHCPLAAVTHFGLDSFHCNLPGKHSINARASHFRGSLSPSGGTLVFHSWPPELGRERARSVSHEIAKAVGVPHPPAGAQAQRGHLEVVHPRPPPNPTDLCKVLPTHRRRFSPAIHPPGHPRSHRASPIILLGLVLNAILSWNLGALVYP
jgi:hypothetical protein